MRQRGRRRERRASSCETMAGMQRRRRRWSCEPVCLPAMSPWRKWERRVAAAHVADTECEAFAERVGCRTSPLGSS